MAGHTNLYLGPYIAFVTPRTLVKRKVKLSCCIDEIGSGGYCSMCGKAKKLFTVNSDEAINHHTIASNLNDWLRCVRIGELDVWLPNVDIQLIERVGVIDANCDSAWPIEDGLAEVEKATLLDKLAPEIDKLRGAYGQAGEVKFGLVVIWE